MKLRDISLPPRFDTVIVKQRHCKYDYSGDVHVVVTYNNNEYSFTHHIYPAWVGCMMVRNYNDDMLRLYHQAEISQEHRDKLHACLLKLQTGEKSPHESREIPDGFVKPEEFLATLNQNPELVYTLVRCGNHLTNTHNPCFCDVRNCSDCWENDINHFYIGDLEKTIAEVYRRSGDPRRE